jgi:hypothetical protein
MPLVFLKTDHSGIVWNCCTRALAYLGAARTNALHSKTSQERMPIASWRSPPTRISSPSRKDADPEIPILKQAKAEYSKLQ